MQRLQTSSLNTVTFLGLLAATLVTQLLIDGCKLLYLLGVKFFSFVIYINSIVDWWHVASAEFVKHHVAKKLQRNVKSPVLGLTASLAMTFLFMAPTYLIPYIKGLVPHGIPEECRCTDSDRLQLLATRSQLQDHQEIYTDASTVESRNIVYNAILPNTSLASTAGYAVIDGTMRLNDNSQYYMGFDEDQCSNITNIALVDVCVNTAATIAMQSLNGSSSNVMIHMINTPVKPAPIYNNASGFLQFLNAAGLNLVDWGAADPNPMYIYQNPFHNISGRLFHRTVFNTVYSPDELTARNAVICTDTSKSALIKFQITANSIASPVILTVSLQTYASGIGNANTTTTFGFDGLHLNQSIQSPMSFQEALHQKTCPLELGVYPKLLDKIHVGQVYLYDATNLIILCGVSAVIEFLFTMIRSILRYGDKICVDGYDFVHSAVTIRTHLFGVTPLMAQRFYATRGVTGTRSGDRFELKVHFDLSDAKNESNRSVLDWNSRPGQKTLSSVLEGNWPSTNSQV